MGESMNISEFARARAVEPQTVRHYINSHADIKKYTSKVGKEVELSAQAIEMLDKIYPMPKPVQIIQGISQEEYDAIRSDYEVMLKKAQMLAEQLAAANDKIAQIQTERVDEQKEIADLKGKQFLLEDKEKQLAEANKKVESVEKDLFAALSEKDQALQTAKDAEESIQKIKNELEVKNNELKDIESKFGNLQGIFEKIPSPPTQTEDNFLEIVEWKKKKMKALSEMSDRELILMGYSPMQRAVMKVAAMVGKDESDWDNLKPRFTK